MKLTVPRLLMLGLGAALLALIVWAFLPPPVEVDAGLVERGDMMVTVDHEGKTRVKDRYVVSSPLGGKLARINHRPGDPVDIRRTMLAIIEPVDPALLDVRTRTQAEAGVEAARAALKQAKTNLERTRTLHDQALKELVRVRGLRQNRVISEADFDLLAFKEQTTGAEHRSAEFAHRIAEYELEQAQAALIHTRPRSPGETEPFRFEVASPITGLVLRVFQESSTVVQAGTRLMEVGDPVDLECEIDVLSTDAVKVLAGQRVLLEHWGGSEPLNGRVRVREPSGFTKISALGVEEQRVNIIVDLVDPPTKRPTLGDGYRVEARIIIWEGKDVVKVPAGSLFRRGNVWQVFLVERGRVVAREVSLGRNNGLEAEVLEGLKPGDRVVLHPGDRVVPGAKVQIRSGE